MLMFCKFKLLSFDKWHLYTLWYEFKVLCFTCPTLYKSKYSKVSLTCFNTEPVNSFLSLNSNLLFPLKIAHFIEYGHSSDKSKPRLVYLLFKFIILSVLNLLSSISILCFLKISFK